MKNQILIYSLFLACFTSSGQTQDSLQQLWEARFKQIRLEDSLYKAKVFLPGEKIELEFYLEKKQIQLNNNFEIYFIVIDSIGKEIIKPKVGRNSFLLPNLEGDKKGWFAIKYRNRVYATYGFFKQFSINNSIRIVFDSRPYFKGELKDQYNNNVFSGIQNKSKEKNVNAYLQIRYNRQWTYSLLSIENINGYFKESQKLIE